MKTATIYLSLGSNLGDRSAMLRTGIKALANSQIRVKKISSFYETEPVDFLDQPWFLNCVVEGETNLSPQELLLALRGIESLLGSKKEFAKGPRLLDMDILLYGDETMDTPELQIPHPRMLRKLPPRESIPPGTEPRANTSRNQRTRVLFANCRRLINEYKPGTNLYSRTKISVNTFRLEAIEEKRAIVVVNGTVWHYGNNPQPRKKES